MLKKILLATALVLVPTLGFVACDGSAVTECTSDADCPADQPVCDTSSDPGLCVPEGDDPECEEDLDCQLANADSATSTDDCSANADCGAGDERCVEDQVGVTYCALVTDVCDGTSTATDIDDVEGGTFTTCLGDGSCTEDGACE